MNDPTPSCAQCGRSIDEHTIREIRECGARGAIDLPYEPIPGDPIQQPLAGTPMHDALIVRAGAIDLDPVAAAALGFGKLAAVLFDFSTTGRPGTETRMFVASPTAMHDFARYTFDACRAAAKAADPTVGKRPGPRRRA